MHTHRGRCVGFHLVALLAILFAPCRPLVGQEVLERARQRHAKLDSELLDYRSRLNTLVSVGLITDPMAPPKLVVASELASGVAWNRDEGLQIHMLGQRYVSGFRFGDDVDLGLDFDEPWFVATTPGDSLRLLGQIELPDRAAVHPFAARAEEYYEYAIGDTVTLFTTGRQVELVEIRVTPTRGDAALVIGSIWVDALTGDVGAMQVQFVGKYLWADEDDPEGSAWANRILSLSATVENGLWEQRFWLPHHQEIELHVRVPFIGNFAFPIVFQSDFGRYDVNTGEPIAWLSPDSVRQALEDDETYEEETRRVTMRVGEEVEVESTETKRGGVDFGVDDEDVTRIRAGSWQGGWEIIRPPKDSLDAYDEWDRPLEAPAEKLTLPSAEELERRAQELGPEITGRKMFAIQYDRIPDFIRYNRVEALAIGGAARYDLPRRPFWSLGGGASFGVADLEPKARLDIRYDAPRNRNELAGYSELHTTGSALTDTKRAFGSSALRAFFLGRDDYDYYRSSGAAVSLRRRWNRFRADVALAFEDHRSVERNTQVAIPGIWEDSVFQPNPPAIEGQFWRGDLATTIYLGSWERPSNRAELALGLEAGTGEGFDYLQPRVDFDSKFDIGSKLVFVLDAHGGWSAGDVPFQRLWGIGGLWTVRGYTFGTRRGDSFWTGRLELAYKRRVWRPVVFGDVGWAGDVDDFPGGGASGDVLWSAGAGISLLNGLFRTDLVVNDDADVWFEMYFAGDL